MYSFPLGDAERSIVRQAREQAATPEEPRPKSPPPMRREVSAITDPTLIPLFERNPRLLELHERHMRLMGETSIPPPDDAAAAQWLTAVEHSIPLPGFLPDPSAGAPAPAAPAAVTARFMPTTHTLDERLEVAPAPGGSRLPL